MIKTHSPLSAWFIVLLVSVLAIAGCQSGKTQETTTETEEIYSPIDSGITHLDGVKSQMVLTDRISSHVLTYRDAGIPVVFLHGNFSAARTVAGSGWMGQRSMEKQGCEFMLGRVSGW